APPLWTAVALLPGRERRRRLARGIARGLARLLGMPFTIQGLEHLAGPGPRIVVSNHQSYLDGCVLTGLLPPEHAYVVKRELRGNVVSRVFLERLGAVFVERFDPAQGAEETRKVLERVRAGESLVVFPEGTFYRYPGLLPFRLGAFAVAAEAGVPVVPVTIRGTRSLLRGDDFFPRRGAAAVEIGPPIHPQGQGWDAAVRLRDAARADILCRCGEPDLGAQG
ncbi:MAG TPA: lysophospholipid acyltransferase family protein, partial [Thermoanaerobaculia bacterium]|nr:lysophospholipid acyltransferase family protein [Thermoanaerobaculia bacterium]